MNNFKVLTFTNPNKQRPIKIRAGAIAGFDFSESTKSNVIYAAGGMFPVAESLEEIQQAVEAVDAPLARGASKDGK